MSGRYPAIAIAITATLLRAKSFTLDDEAVVSPSSPLSTGVGPSARPCCTRGQDLRGLPLGDRKKRLARLLGKRRLGIVLSDHTDEDGAAIFQQACKLGLEGIVSKRLSADYRSGPSRDWIKDKNPNEQPRNDATSRGALVMRSPRDYGWNPIESAPLDEDIALQVTDGRGAVYAPMAMSANSDRLDQCEEGNTA